MHKVVLRETNIIFFFNNKCHRTHGPAVIDFDGNEQWWLNDAIHRENGPALTYSNGIKMWYKHDKFLDVCFQKSKRTTR